MAFQIRIGSVLLATYVFFCLFAHFAFHAVGAHYSELVYSEFQASYGKEIGFFKWATEVEFSLRSGALIGSMAGFAVALPTFLLLCYGIEKATVGESKGALIGIIVFSLYVGGFCFSSLLGYPYFLVNGVDLLIGIVFGGISCLVANQYISSEQRTNDRKLAQVNRLRLEHEAAKELLHTSTWFISMMTIGVFFVTVYVFWYSIPPEITSSTSFRLAIIPIFMMYLMICGGFFVGLPCQYTIEMRRIAQTSKKLETDN